ncbi:MAG: hypothetical protein LBR95_09130 [Azoarcus sp.]|jgi:hypothetical protein|nr:hypothetical protein [Azoarcus sp.]
MESFMGPKFIIDLFLIWLYLCGVGFCALFGGRKFLPKLLFKFLLSLLVLLSLPALYGLAEKTYQSIRNYYEYCTWEKGDLRGRRFTTQERLDIAINDYLENQISMDYNEIKKAERIWDDAKKRFTLIPYGGKDEFLRVNPGCCQLTWHRSEGYEFEFWARAEGIGNGMFDFKHKVRYMDQEGSRKEIETTNTYTRVSNCGHPRSKFYL